VLITIVGKRGRGKTSLVKQLIEDSDADVVKVLDFIGEYEEEDDDRIIISRGYIYPFLKEAWESTLEIERTLVVLDEIDVYSKYDRYIEFTYKYGRHGAIDMIAVSRTFFNLPVICRRLTDAYYLFGITEWSDIQYLRHHKSPEFCQQIMNLDFFEYKKVDL